LKLNNCATGPGADLLGKAVDYHNRDDRRVGLGVLGADVRLAAKQQGTPEYIAQAGLQPAYHAVIRDSGEHHLYSAVLLASRMEPDSAGTVRERLRAVLVGYLASINPDTKRPAGRPGEKDVARALRDIYPLPGPPQKQPPAFKVRNHPDATQVVSVPSGHISPFTLGERLTPDAVFDNPEDVKSVSTVLLMAPGPNDTDRLWMPIDLGVYLQMTAGHYRELLEQLVTCKGCYQMNA
jgi:hypothetical protein